MRRRRLLECQSRLRSVEHAATLSQAEAVRERSEHNARVQQLQEELDKAKKAAGEQKVRSALARHAAAAHSVLPSLLSSLTLGHSLLSTWRVCAGRLRVRRPTGPAICSS